MNSWQTNHPCLRAHVWPCLILSWNLFIHCRYHFISMSFILNKNLFAPVLGPGWPLSSDSFIYLSVLPMSAIYTYPSLIFLLVLAIMFMSPMFYHE